jgi:hypothetical protein
MIQMWMPPGGTDDVRHESKSSGGVGIAACLCAGLALAVLMTAGARAGAARGTEARVFGWIENVRLYPGGLTLAAKLDTGARTSSVDTQDYKIFERGGRRWVRFRVSNRKGNTVQFERPILRIARIRRSATKTTERPVIKLGLCLGMQYREVEVNLTNRAHLNHPMLVGRTSMAGLALVDSSQENTADPRCSPESNRWKPK